MLASLDRESSRNYWLCGAFTREDQQSLLYMQKAFIDQQMQKSDDKPFWWRSFSSYNRRENMKIAALSSKFWRQSQIAVFISSWETKWWCTLLLWSWIQLLERLVKPLGLKSQQKWLAKTKALELLCPCGDAVKHVCEIWNILLLLTRFLRVSLNEKLLLLTFSTHFFYLVFCIWEF